MSLSMSRLAAAGSGVSSGPFGKTLKRVPFRSDGQRKQRCVVSGGNGPDQSSLYVLSVRGITYATPSPAGEGVFFIVYSAVPPARAERQNTDYFFTCLYWARASEAHLRKCSAKSFFTSFGTYRMVAGSFPYRNPNQRQPCI